MATKTAKKTTTKKDDSFSIAVGNFAVSTDDVKSIVTDSAYATVGAGDLAVSVARDLPGRLDTLRKEQATLVKEAPAKAQSFVKEAPSKLQNEINEQLSSVRGEVQTYATRGRKLVNSISDANATKKALSQTETARSQVKGAVTSIRKAVEQSQQAAQKAVSRLGNRR